MTRVGISAEAEADLSSIIDQYLQEAGVEVTQSFLQAWDRWLVHVAQFPDSGSPRLQSHLRLPGLRVWPVPGFPYVGIYIAQAGHIRVARVLHGQRDIPARFRE